MNEKSATFAASDVVSLFPTLVWKMQLTSERRKPIDRAILGTMEKLRRNQAELRSGESWQSPNDLQRLPELEDLCSCVRQAARIVLRFLSVPDAAVEMTGCWVNLNAPGAAHRVHTHPNNYLSGVYYVQTAEGANLIYFHDPRPQSGIMRPPVTALTSVNADQAVVTVSNGTLLLFPAWLPHSVPANESRDLRISVSFNLMFSPYTETMSKPMW